MAARHPHADAEDDREDTPQARVDRFIAALPRGWPRWLRPQPGSAIDTSLRAGNSPWTDVVHVLWSAWVFVTPAFAPQGHDLRWWLLTALSYPLFLALFARTLVAAPDRVWPPAVGMAALALALMPWYPSALSYFVFGCVMLRPHRGMTPVGYVALLAALNALLLGYGLWLGYPLVALAWMPVVTTIIGVVVQVEWRNRRREAALRLSRDEVRRLAAMAERERIGRDLHDLLGHTLSLVAVKTDLARRLLDRDTGAAARELDEVAAVARDALAQVRSAVTGIRATGLAGERASARLLLECDGIQLVDDGDGGVDPATLPLAIEQALALTLREAVTNVQRHARAGRVRMALSREADDVVLRIADDGRGGALVPGNGLGGMRERLEALGGRLRIAAPAGRGTTVEARVPLPSP